MFSFRIGPCLLDEFVDLLDGHVCTRLAPSLFKTMASVFIELMACVP